jgi:diadenosine tetraphosphate (Ap4A) HIT family hydrolase
MCTGADCPLCRSRPNAIAELESSWVLVGPNDPVRGYACLVFSRHAVELHELSPTEGAAFMHDAQRLSAAVAQLMEPIKLNYEIHGNTVPHLHMHFFPRYVGDAFEGRPIDPRSVARPVYAPGEYTRFRSGLQKALARPSAA